MSFSNDFQTFLTLAEAYFHIGYSVIPLLGDHDPSRPKVPAIPWAAFQQQRATVQDYDQWFAHYKFAGLGIVTGRVSQLVVLDFDSEAVFNTFKSQYPDLLETHTVRSAGRQLPHLYFRLPPHLHLASQKGQGIDLLSDGRYVVAPPTTINGQSYKIVRGGMPKPLTERDIRRLQAFLNAHKSNPPASHTDKIPSSTLSPLCREDGGEAAPSNPAMTQPTPADLHAIYHHLAATRGRNEALFHTSLYARDRCLTLQQTENALVTFHSRHQGASPDRETAQQRQHEALKTIRSAFSRPPRALSPSTAYGLSATETIKGKGLVFNSVRESLLQQKMTYVLRTYEGLLQSGMRPGQRFTAAEALKRLKGTVGRDSILKALKAGQGDLRFFAPVSPRNTPNGIAYNHSEKESKKCFLIESKNQEKPYGGRPNHQYRLPSNKELCRMLGVKPTKSDAVDHNDLGTARKTRMALHRELIKRRPGSYPKRWLAARLGVSRRTIFTYNQLMPIHSRAMFLETPIHWKTITRLPLDEPLQGAYVQTLRGKKFPALRQIASNLLAKGETLCLKQQTASYYWYGDCEPSPLEWVKLATQQAQKQEALEAFLSQPPAAPPIISQPIMIDPPRSFTPVSKPHKSNLIFSPHDYKKPLKNDSHETLATQLYEVLNSIGGPEFQKLSRATARHLATTVDPALLSATLATLKQRAAAQIIRNPVGFFITLIRGSKRALV